MRSIRTGFNVMALIVALVAQSLAVSAAEKAKVPTLYKRNVVCMAGCGADAPVRVYDRYPPLAFHPEPQQKGAPAFNEIYRGVWCGKKGGCVAPNVVPPRYWVRDYDRPSVSMVFWFR